ncbi:RNA polymerase sigma factor [Myxococcus llanfairpwllgwyngyllgogerychwyrndrobwllllantysiliogogogochensis]|uniref:RNA polymerase sigma factor n=1 Tax=Myxococcus llanfairpwllgwyngyllgogerychwyrndrobwllllantysiliogogogochensis TaxID=2590453 RepID=A0A540X0N0_9BACT|nr:sigma-70 family RNA polymerase sigma factor [Myxococcus llanfairpwllgwyngyllgogerychwyrndrobwllllantysiliogogogochensis]NTX01365.1 sigma-70 family RNA polymerase sigma factor [Myxococcus sp. CA040A]TQF14821.1 sigma-70 family RNA polymerase sigma factor [Myxococcus llanfairpwllgwyngyllgogerychwyrndrobwllllantysiliogogogochensis]
MGSTEGLAEWVRRAASGETSAFSELYRRTRPLVARLMAGFAPLDPDEVEDVIQETFVRAFRALPRLKEAGAFEAWLLSIARNRARTRLERKASVRRLEDDIADPEPETVPALPEALQLERDIEVVRQLISELPEGEEKRTVQLFYIEGELSAREIAEQLGVGKSAVTMRLERFRGRIKRELLRRVLAGRWE